MRRPIHTILLFSGILMAALVTALSCGVWVATGATPDGKRLERIQASPQYDTEAEIFVNLLEQRLPRFGQISGEYWRNEARTEPEQKVPRVDGLSQRLQTPPPDDLRVSWIGHSTMLIELEGRRFLTDPVFSHRASPVSWLGPARFLPPALALDELPPIDAVVISHDHYDHLDLASIEFLHDQGAIFFAPLGVGEHLEYWGVAADRIVEMDWWQEATLHGIRVACLHSRHFSERGVFDRDLTLWASWALIGDRRRVFFSGDTALTPEFLTIGETYGPFDIAMLESGAYNAAWADFHLGPEQAVDAHIMVRGRLMIPIHWGTFSLALHAWTEPAERLMVDAKERGVHLVIPKVGESVGPNTPATTEPWWPRIPWQKREEAPVISGRLPPIRFPEVLAPLPPQPPETAPTQEPAVLGADDPAP